MNTLETVEYDQIHNFVDRYTPETPASCECGFMAQSLQKDDALKYAIAGGAFDDETE